MQRPVSAHPTFLLSGTTTLPVANTENEHPGITHQNENTAAEGWERTGILSQLLLTKYSFALSQSGISNYLCRCTTWFWGWLVVTFKSGLICKHFETFGLLKLSRKGTDGGEWGREVPASLRFVPLASRSSDSYRRQRKNI